MDTFNRFGVSVQGDNVLMLMPPRAPLTPDQALVLAAWLVALADPLGEKFEAVLAAVRST